ncbi:hypothetical protein [Falsibacillus albus]|uniref:Uncharacterized protein n=1 Tax=Falsibacillus albus TaxID=2478915 RepID=A0A3L7K149_9BACI|nr:hypothetical protein [Falsibacillus albus]RLQ96807.1 hypothetical protein D9X91_06820 [Falsibacillus albus]
MFWTIIAFLLAIFYWFFHIRLFTMYVRYGIPLGAVIFSTFTVVVDILFFIRPLIMGTFMDGETLFGMGFISFLLGLWQFAVVTDAPKDIPKWKKGKIFSETWEVDMGNDGF